MFEMLEIQRAIHVRVPDDRELVNEVRRRIRTAAERFGRPVETHYLKSSGILFGVVPLTPAELEVGELAEARSLHLRHRSTRRPPH